MGDDDVRQRSKNVRNKKRSNRKNNRLKGGKWICRFFLAFRKKKNNLSIFDDKNPLPQDTSDNFSTLLTEKNQQIKRNKPPVQSTPLPDIQRRRQIFNKVAYRLSSPDLLVDTDQPIIKKPNESNFDDDIEFDDLRLY